MKSTKKTAQSLIEYGLILALVAVIAVTVLGKFGKSITGVGDNATNAVDASSNNSLDNYCKSVDTASAGWDKDKGQCK